MLATSADTRFQALRDERERTRRFFGVLMAVPWIGALAVGAASGAGASARWIEPGVFAAIATLTLAIAMRHALRRVQETAARTAALEEEIARRREAEQELGRAVDDLRAAERRGEAAARTRSEFLAELSRELRTPLNAIVLHCELLQQDAPGRLHREFAEDLQKIRSSGSELLTLLNGIVDLSKIDAGRMTMSLERFDFRALLQSVVQTVDPLVQKNGNRVAVYYADDFGSMCADVMKTRQILLNILTNAAKFTHGGTITVDVGLDHTASRRMAFVAVTDTGVGMTPQQMVRIFDPFARGGPVAQKTASGLGLAIVSRFCRLMGGTVAVESCPGRGSRFIVRLPLEVAESSDAADAA